jgi:hypothetical protein
MGPPQRSPYIDRSAFEDACTACAVESRRETAAPSAASSNSLEGKCMTNHRWQVPISLFGQPLTKKRAHFFEHSTDTHRLVPALCGERYNPGFAVLPRETWKARCVRCTQLIPVYQRRLTGS